MEFRNKCSNKSLSWLLEDDNPAIKYRTLTEICGSDNSDEISILYESIWMEKAIQKMLKRQDEDGYWNKKDYGMFTSLRYLNAFAEYGLQKNQRIDAYVDLSIEELAEVMKEDASGCSTPLVLRALVMMGYYNRDDIQNLIQQFTHSQLSDGGFMCKRLLDKRPERKSCYKATVAALLLYAECKRRGIVIDQTDRLIQYFTKRDVFYDSKKTKLILDGKFGWRNIDNFFPVEPLRIGLPLIVEALSVLGVGNHPALVKAWDYINEKTDDEGKLTLDGTFTKQPCSFGKVGQPNKWVTFYALLAQKYK